ncbi:MAG: CaiB/BaiF CoA transferase family protein [Thermoplasmata archaeon]
MRVIEIGHIVAGPTAGLLLADLGFEVIKVERPGYGDISRTLTGTSSGAYPFYNRNKKSITIDLKKKEGVGLLKNMIKHTDVLIDNLGYGALYSLGLDYEKMSELNNGLIYLSIRGYGEGPYEKRKSLDFPIEVHSGLAYMTGTRDRPMRVGASIVDMSAAMFGVIAVLNAIIEREKTGKGKKITIGMFETAEFFMGQHIASHQLIGRDLKPLNEEGFAWGIYDFFNTLDEKKIFIAVTTDDQWKKFCGIFSLNADEFPTNAIRYSNRDKLIPKISELISRISLEEITKLLDRENISYAILNKPWDLLNDLHAQNKMVEVKYSGKNLKVPISPLGNIQLSDPPQLGENTEEILKTLGYSLQEIERFKKEHII